MLFLQLVISVLFACQVSFSYGLKSFNAIKTNNYYRNSITSSSSSSSGSSILKHRYYGISYFSSLMSSKSVDNEPIILNNDKNSGVATLKITLNGDATSKAFNQACELFNNEVKSRGYKVPGFRPGAKLPPMYLYEIFGEDKVKLFCGTLLGGDIQDQCEKTGLMFVGRGRIMQFNEDSFEAGQPHTLTVECDLWPEFTYNGPNGYKGLAVTASKGSFDSDKYEQVKKSIQERYKILTPTPMGYSANIGDVVTINMKGYEKKSDGSKGSPLPAIASGDNVDVVLEKGKFMEGFVEGLTGALVGDKRNINVKFPTRPSGPGAALSGKEAVFDVDVIAVKTKTLPEWNEELAARVRDGLTLADMDKEVRAAIEGESQSTTENARNEALASALVDITTISRIPDSLMEENTQQRFQNMLMEFKEQGSTDEQLAEMTTPENYKRYKEISRPNVEKVVKLGMIFRDLAEKENISVGPDEIKEQYDMICVQAKQRGEAPPDERNARDEIENILLKKKVFDKLASYSTITWKEIEIDKEPKK